MADVLDLAPRDLLRVDPAGPDLRALRLAEGLSAIVLAERLHLSKQTYLRWEAGRWQRLPDRATLESMAQALAVDTHEVIAAFRLARGA